MNSLIKCEMVKNNRLFLVTASPKNDNIDEYIQYLKSKSINVVIKLTEKDLYDVTKFKENNIEFIHMELKDGNVPSKDDIIKLIEISDDYKSICVHCTAGLGRAPLVMCLIWILQFNQDPFDTASEIRNKIPNCLNQFQINFLTKFKRKEFIKEKKCIIM